MVYFLIVLLASFSHNIFSSQNNLFLIITDSPDGNHNSEDLYGFLVETFFDENERPFLSKRFRKVRLNRNEVFYIHTTEAARQKSIEDADKRKRENNFGYDMYRWEQEEEENREAQKAWDEGRRGFYQNAEKIAPVQTSLSNNGNDDDQQLATVNLRFWNQSNSQVNNNQQIIDIIKAPSQKINIYRLSDRQKPFQSSASLNNNGNDDDYVNQNNRPPNNQVALVNMPNATYNSKTKDGRAWNNPYLWKK